VYAELVSAHCERRKPIKRVWDEGLWRIFRPTWWDVTRNFTVYSLHLVFIGRSNHECWYEQSLHHKMCTATAVAYTDCSSPWHISRLPVHFPSFGLIYGCVSNFTLYNQMLGWVRNYLEWSGCRRIYVLSQHFPMRPEDNHEEPEWV
jgi:hypothetical protein